MRKGKVSDMDNLITVNSKLTSTSSKELTSDLYGRFISFLDASPKTQQTYERAIRQFAKYLYIKGETHPTRESVLAYREELTASGHKPTTIQNYITAVKLFFRWTEQEGLYPNIADHIKGAKLSKEHKKDYLTSSQVKNLLSSVDRDTLRGSRDYAILSLIVTGGLRTIEVSRADVADLRTVGDSPALFIQGKGKEEKTDYVKLPPEVDTAIRAYLKMRGTSNPEAPLFASTSNNGNGERMSTRSISGIVKEKLVSAGYDSERLTAHSLRHTAVTLALLGGESLEEAQQFARHANIQTTMIYNHAIERAKNTCSATIASAIF